MTAGRIRPLVRHACDTLTELNRLHACGKISRDRLHREQLSVLHATVAGLTVTGADRTSSAAGAPPGEADPVEPVAPKLSARLLHTYAADGDSVKGHTA